MRLLDCLYRMTVTGFLHASVSSCVFSNCRAALLSHMTFPYLWLCYLGACRVGSERVAHLLVPSDCDGGHKNFFTRFVPRAAGMKSFFVHCDMVSSTILANAKILSSFLPATVQTYVHVHIQVEVNVLFNCRNPGVT